MKIAVDTCVGKAGVRLLEWGGHEVVVVAEEGEADREWFARALKAGAEIVIASDVDVEILCYDNRVAFFQAKQHVKGHIVAERFLRRHPTKVSA